MPKARLLLIEDDFELAEMLQLYFSSHDYDVLHADTGELGIETARTQFPDLVLLDVMLPDMDGYDVCVQLRQGGLTKYIPTIFLTRRDEMANKVKGLQLGADDYITKPFDNEELRLRIDGSIRRATREHLHEPRTGLPTGRLVDEELAARPVQHVARLWLRGFSEYADVYSFIAAEDALFHAGQIIRDVLAELGTPSDFVGIQDDIFVLASATDKRDQLLNTIQERFVARAAAFYTFSDASQGGITLDPGTESERFVPIMRFEITQE